MSKKTLNTIMLVVEAVALILAVIIIITTNK